MEKLISGKEKAIIRNTEYNAILEEIDAIRVETVHTAQEIILKGKLEIGERIADQKLFGVTNLVMALAHDLRWNERDLWYCVKFYQNYDKIKKLPEFDSKALSWNKVKKMITDPEKHEKVCGHKNTETYVVCVDCGKRIKE